MKILFPTLASVFIVKILAFLGEESASCERIMSGGEQSEKMLRQQEK